MLVRRNVMPSLLELLETFRVVTVSGPRQSGKTTLVNAVVGRDRGAAVLSLDDEALLQAAIEDPTGFVASPSRPLVIDEVQRAGEPLVRAIKRQVDRDPRPGQFLLTGSADFLTVPQISESLAGRTMFLELWPFSQGEVEGLREGFIDRAFDDPDSLRSFSVDAPPRPDMYERVCRGGFPEVQALTGRRRDEWFGAYVRTVVERDITELGNIRRGGDVPRLLRLLAARSGSEVVMQDVIRDADLARQTVYDYVALLRAVGLVHELPAWSRSLTSRAKRHPKLFIADPGLAAFLVGATPTTLSRPGAPALGGLVETFAIAEVLRQRAWAERDVSLYHFRDRAGSEVDLVLEGRDGRVVGIEIKASSTVRPEHFRGLRLVRDELGADFIHGFVLYLGDQPLPFGDRLSALPIASLWRTISLEGSSRV